LGNINLAGIRRHFLDEGDDTVLVLLHSFGGSSAVGGGLVAALRQRLRAIAPDLILEVIRSIKPQVKPVMSGLCANRWGRIYQRQSGPRGSSPSRLAKEEVAEKAGSEVSERGLRYRPTHGYCRS
jgi:pimeloyl-ACP methyl ester carboxylesterase